MGRNHDVKEQTQLNDP